MRIKKIGKIFRSHQKQLYVLALSITKNREMAEDAVHDAIVAVANTQSKVKNLKAYLITSVRNKALYACVKNERNQSTEENYLETDYLSADQSIFAQQIIDSIKLLNTDQQQILIMKIFGDLTFKEIAEMTHNSPNTVASWYRRGLKILQEKYNER